MLCEKFEALDPKSKTIFIGEVLHAVQSDDAMFDIATEIVNQGKRRGLFEGVTFLPPREQTDNLPPIN